jgi:hypothetical protein
MTQTTNIYGAPLAPEDLRPLERRVDDLARRIAELTQIVSAVVVAPTRVLETPASRQIDEFELRVGDQERRSESMESLIRGHEKMLRMICIILKNLDDPYGMGTGLDERIGLDEGSLDRGEDGESS